MEWLSQSHRAGARSQLRPARPLSQAHILLPLEPGRQESENLFSKKSQWHLIKTKSTSGSAILGASGHFLSLFSRVIVIKSPKHAPPKNPCRRSSWPFWSYTQFLVPTACQNTKKTQQIQFMTLIAKERGVCVCMCVHVCILSSEAIFQLNLIPDLNTGTR